MAIKKLPKNIHSLIAAGEVIERPASVIRELMQNSIDAGATDIAVEIEEGGTKFISVTDNGSGIAPDDIELSIEEHATSKIATKSDLHNILTYGFRGEALHSIASVSLMEIESSADEEGSSISVKEGNIIDKSITALPAGTRIVVRELFRNFPARRKFLKRAYTEMNYCSREFQYHALANPEINMRFISDGRTVFPLRSGSLKNRAAELLSTDFIDHAFEIDTATALNGKLLRIRGFVGKPELFDNRKFNFNYIFINRRFIFDRMIRKAVYSAFDTQLRGRFCPYIIFLEVPPDMLDVNIHPAKKEVKFHNENDVFRIIVQGIKEAVRRSGEERKNEFTQTGTSVRANEIESEPGMLFNDTDIESAQKMAEYRSGEQSGFWQFMKTYIITELKNTVYIIDQHAAHERIMYERFRETAEFSVQKLLFPETVKLSADLMEIFNENIELIRKNGFQAKQFGPDIVMLEGVPSIIDARYEISDFVNMLEDLSKGNDIESIDDRIKIIACRTAIKAGEKLSQLEMAKIFRDLFNCSNPYACPHGRPTMINLSKEDMEKWFRRT